MSIHDRDWYRDAIRRREAREENRQRQGPRRADKASMHWTVRLLWWVGIFLIAHLINKYWLWPIAERALQR
jgi:hypothetical protein